MESALESFKAVFVAVFVGTALVVAAALLNQRRPELETSYPTADLVRATGQCASCHREETARRRRSVRP